MPRSRTFSRGRSRPQRRMEWTGASVDGVGVLAPGVTGAAYLLLPSQTAAYTDATLVRLRGAVYVWNSSVAGVLNDFNGAIGVIPWDDIDDTVPTVAERPDPWNNPDLDWVWHSYLYGIGGGTVADQGTMGRTQRIEVDSRAMRRLGENKGLIVCVRNDGPQDFIYAWGMRCLLKE